MSLYSKQNQWPFVTTCLFILNLRRAAVLWTCRFSDGLEKCNWIEHSFNPLICLSRDIVGIYFDNSNRVRHWMDVYLIDDVLYTSQSTIKHDQLMPAWRHSTLRLHDMSAATLSRIDRVAMTTIHLIRVTLQAPVVVCVDCAHSVSVGRVAAVRSSRQHQFIHGFNYSWSLAPSRRMQARVLFLSICPIWRQKRWKLSEWVSGRVVTLSNGCRLFPVGPWTTCFPELINEYTSQIMEVL